MVSLVDMAAWLPAKEKRFQVLYYCRQHALKTSWNKQHQRPFLWNQERAGVWLHKLWRHVRCNNVTLYFHVLVISWIKYFDATFNLHSKFRYCLSIAKENISHIRMRHKCLTVCVLDTTVVSNLDFRNKCIRRNKIKPYLTNGTGKKCVWGRCVCVWVDV